jgi:hypothetical protein
MELAVLDRRRLRSVDRDALSEGPARHGTNPSGALAVIVVALAVGLDAQILPGPKDVQSLLSLRSLKCSFPWYASADWDADEPKIKIASQGFTFNIDSIDYKKGSARLIGNAGAVDLGADAGESSASFLEIVPVGTPNLTTVYAWRNREGHFKAVHSRHTAIGGPSPSQNYGWCQAW